MDAADPRPTFAVKLDELRTAAGLTQQRLADKTAVPLATIRRLEAGANERSPAWGMVVRLAVGVGVPCRVYSACGQELDGS